MDVDPEGRQRRAVYLPPECWAWLEQTARRDGTARSDLLEGLVLLAMDDAEDQARRPRRVDELVTPEMLARYFHSEYERIAPELGYKTRPESAVAWDDVPELNRRVMGAVAASVLMRFLPDRMAVPFEPTA